MKRRLWRCVTGALAISWLAGCSAPDDTVRVFVAASLVDVAQEWQRDFADSGGRFEIHSGGSAMLGRQILAGAEADLLLTAGRSAIRDLQQADRVARIDTEYMHNHIVAVVSPHVNPPETLVELTDSRFARIAIANPATAPAGEYARIGLENAGLWETLRPRLVFTDDVRGVLAAAATGAVDAGFVYTTDARTMPNLRAVEFKDASPFPEATYPLVMLAPETESKAALWRYLHSEDARDIAARYGFER